MINIQNLVIDILLLMFPLLIYLFYGMHIENTNQAKNYVYLDFALLSSLYLNFTNGNYIVLGFIPLTIAYLKKRDLTAIFLSILISLKTSYLIIVGLAIIYFIYCLYKKKLIKENYLIVSIIAMSLVDSDRTIVSYVVNILVFASAYYLIVYVYFKIEKIIKLHVNVEEIIKGKQYQTTLFKITHEIKNPIAVCKSYLDMFDINNKNHEEYIEILKCEMDKILLLLQDFSSLTNIKIEKEEMDIVLLVEDVVKQFQPFFKSKCNSYKYSLVDDEIYIYGDYNRLSQVLVNIIKNSLESKESGLDIKIETKRNKSYFDIIISDNGCGFDMKELKKIKEPFYTTKKTGTGLGVALSNEIITAHNGELIYNSKIKKGTIVTVRIPMVAE